MSKSSLKASLMCDKTSLNKERNLKFCITCFAQLLIFLALKGALELQMSCVCQSVCHSALCSKAFSSLSEVFQQSFSSLTAVFQQSFKSLPQRNPRIIPFGAKALVVLVKVGISHELDWIVCIIANKRISI